jgi:hypothetical protein
MTQKSFFNSQEDQEIFLFSERLDRRWSPPSLINEFRGSFLEENRPRYEANQKKKENSNTKVKNEWIYIST